MPPKLPKQKTEITEDLLPEQPTLRDQQIEELQETLAFERDARIEDRFVFVIVGVLLLDVVFFSLMPTFGGPLAILILELLIFVPLARRMGMDEVAKIMSRVIGRVSDGIHGDGGKNN